MAKLKKEEKEKFVREFGDAMRRKGGVEWRSAVVHEERKEFFRGKDLLRFSKSQPEKLEGFCDTGKPIEEQVKELCESMVSMQLIVACDRFYRKPHPGRKYLVKFPRKLQLRPRTQQSWDPEAFYCWLEDRPMPPWQIALSIIFAVVVMALCLFPLAPYKLRLAVVYCFLGLLGSIFALIAVRFVIFLTIFTATGYEFWLFPNLLSDQVDVMGAFVPVMSFAKPEDGKSHLGTRIGGLISAVVLVYMMYVYSPDEKTIKANLQRAESSILDMVHQVNNPSIGAGDNYEAPPQFGTDRNLDPEKIRKHRMNEKLRKKREREKAKRQAQERPEEPAVGSTDGVNDSAADGARTEPSASDASTAGGVDASTAETGSSMPPSDDAPSTNAAADGATSSPSTSDSSDTGGTAASTDQASPEDPTQDKDHTEL